MTLNDAALPELVDQHREQRIRSALAHADPSILRMVLLQLTEDHALTEMRVEKKPIRAGVLMLNALAPEHHDEVRRRMLNYLLTRRGQVPPPPPMERQRELMELFVGHPLNEVEVRYGIEELALADDPRRVEWSTRPSREQLKGFKVCIIGAGISGLSLAIQLRRLGIQFVIIDRLDRIGGTWARNVYPGVRVDVNAFLYQYKFEKRYPWKEFFPPGADIQAYLESVAEKYGIAHDIRLSTEVTSAEWDEAARVWRLRMQPSDGTKSEVHEANILVSASGLFNAAKIPDIDGIKDFCGDIFHTSEWDQRFMPSGKRIALIGNGSSGTQVMPMLAGAADYLGVYQRTPQWISKMENYKAPITEGLQWVIENVPYYWNWLCYSVFSATPQLQTLQEYDRDWQARGGLISESNDKLRQNLIEYINSNLAGYPELISKSTPTTAPLARRPVVDNGWYEALKRDNVELVTEKIVRITSKGILTEDDVEREFDAIVLGTGFTVSKYMWPVKYRGRRGVSLEEQWDADGARAYLGITMPNFPNLFIFYGPNGAPRAGGFYSWAEIWARYISKAIVDMIERGSRIIEVRRDVFEEYNRAMDEATKGLIWESEGAEGYYVNEKGRSGVNMPWRAEDYYAMVEAPDPMDFVIE